MADKTLREEPWPGFNAQVALAEREVAKDHPLLRAVCEADLRASLRDIDNICHRYWRRCQQTLSDIEALADEELSRG